jgi:hypothetical protein
MSPSRIIIIIIIIITTEENKQIDRWMHQLHSWEKREEPEGC